jgi:transcriptional regulator with XRE-family HTH domain
MVKKRSRDRSKHYYEMIDVDYVVSKINNKIKESKITSSAAAKEMGLSRSFLSRVLAKEHYPSSGSLYKIAIWLDVPVQIFFRNNTSKIKYFTGNTLEGIKLTLDNDKTLDKAGRTALYNLMEVAYNEAINV